MRNTTSPPKAHVSLPLATREDKPKINPFLKLPAITKKRAGKEVAKTQSVMIHSAGTIGSAGAAGSGAVARSSTSGI